LRLYSDQKRRTDCQCRETVRESERDNFEYYLFVTVGDRRCSGFDDDNLRGLLWLSLDNEFRPEAAALAQESEQGDDADEASDASNDDTSDDATVNRTTIVLGVCDTYGWDDQSECIDIVGVIVREILHRFTEL